MGTERGHELEALLKGAFERRVQLGLPALDTDAYRLVHGAADGIEGVTVDVYGHFLVVGLLVDRSEADLTRLFDELLSLGFRGIYIKRRPRQANALSDDERKQRSPEHAVRGEDAPFEIVVRESSMPFVVRLGDGLSTGLFLDQRLNRRRVHDVARDKRVLNLFAYTCAFGCAAALGGAASTTNIDVSKGVLERGRQGYARAGIEAEGHLFLARDVLETLPKLARRGEAYDLVVLDPPSYASTKHGRFSVEKDFTGLVAQALGLVSAGGALLACTNLHSLESRAFERMLRTGAAHAGRAVEIELMPPPGDFSPLLGGDPHLKSAWLTVR